jgi:hypothetical protein
VQFQLGFLLLTLDYLNWYLAYKKFKY